MNPQAAKTAEWLGDPSSTGRMDYNAPMDSQQTDRKTIKSWLNCTRFGRIPEIQAHLDAGIDVDLSNSMGYTALIHALNHGKDEAALLLLRAGANPSLTTQTGIRALDAAAEHGCLKSLRMLATASNVNSRPAHHPSGPSPWMRAIHGRRPECLAHLITLGADIAQIGTLDPGQLLRCMRQGGLPILQILVAGGCVIEPDIDPEKDPLALAALAVDPGCETFIRALFDSRELRSNILAPPEHVQARPPRI